MHWKETDETGRWGGVPAVSVPATYSQSGGTGGIAAPWSSHQASPASSPMSDASAAALRAPSRALSMTLKLAEPTCTHRDAVISQNKLKLYLTI